MECFAQGINGGQHNHLSDSPLSSESSMIIEGMNRACRYSPEEKKVRIERYRSKRNQRNFNKKIKVHYVFKCFELQSLFYYIYLLTVVFNVLLFNFYALMFIPKEP